MRLKKNSGDSINELDACRTDVYSAIHSRDSHFDVDLATSRLSSSRRTGKRKSSLTASKQLDSWDFTNLVSNLGVNGRCKEIVDW